MIKPATQSDLSTVSGILQEAAEWLRVTGRPMWRNDELVPDRIAQDVQAGLSRPVCVMSFVAANTSLLRDARWMRYRNLT